jgi:RNA polymerase sigma-70 factor (ECF subfamily)
VNIRETIESDAERGTAQLFAEFGEKLYNTAFLMCRNMADAEDLVLRTFECAVQKISQYDPGRPVFPWLCGILVNCYKMDLRGKARNALDFMDEPPEMADEHSDPAEVLSRMADVGVVHAAMAKLPEKYRMLIALRYFDDLTVPQIAAQLSLAEGSVKRLLHEARAIMREEITRTVGGQGA